MKSKVCVIFSLFTIIIALMSLTGCNLSGNDSNNEEKEINEILNHCQRIDEAQSFYNKFLDLADKQLIKLSDELNPYPENDYYLVTDFQNIHELKEYILKLYSIEIADEYYFKHFENSEYFGNNGPFIIEVDNKLYCDTTRYGGRGGKNIYDYSSLNIVKSCADIATVTIDYYFIMEPDVVKTKTISLIKENNFWVFNDFI